jgi:PKD repeat protein
LPEEVSRALIEGSTKDVLTALGAGSPNRLLYTGAWSGILPPPPSSPPSPPPSGTSPPVASFSYLCTRGSTRCSFDASGSKDDVGIVSYSWNFGDGSPVQVTTQPKTSYRYPVARAYTVTLTVADAGGLTSTQSLYIQVGR